jgi:hypothetical protein
MEKKKFITTTIQEYLIEQQMRTKIPKPNNSFLYHGSNIKNLESIKKYGLLPDFGDIVKGTEVYGQYEDDEYYDTEDKVEGVLFFSDNPNTWSYSHFGGTPNINEAILVIIKKNDTIFRKIGNHVYDMSNNKVSVVRYNRHNYLSVDNIPLLLKMVTIFLLMNKNHLIYYTVRGWLDFWTYTHNLTGDKNKPQYDLS